ncbi:g5941 [Coccomyxa viridis]|uniref:G5941 protein n=1 Tax=Coccomyxa viridis TaxID=1274662 RepID=A0ABP1G0X9_9CHLO
MRTKVADLEAALQANEDTLKALKKEREESARRKAFAARQISTVAAKDQEIAELKTAALVTEQLAARATALCAAAQQSVRLAETAKEAAISCAASAGARTAAARRLIRSAQGRIRSLLAESSEKEKSILDLQGRPIDLSAGTTISSAPATPADPTQSATEPAPTFSAPATPEHPARAASAPDITPSAPATSGDPALAASGIARSSPACLDHPLLQYPEEAPARSTAEVVPNGAAETCVALPKACLPAWLPI